MLIRLTAKEELPEVLALVSAVFNRFEAPDYTPEGAETFRRSVADCPEYLAQITVYGAFSEGKLVGMIATRSGGTHIALFFVDGAYHRRGIGRMLFEEAARHCPTDEMTVNASPYAVEVYHALGFRDTDSEQSEGGMRFTPMRCAINAGVSAAREGDLRGLLSLYTQLHDNPLPPENDPHVAAVWQDICTDRRQVIVTARENDVIVSSCTAVLVPNLTHGQRPYLLIENVITDAQHRGQGLASACIAYAVRFAVSRGCYKAMLLTGSRAPETLSFYCRAGFNSTDKTGMVMWL